MGKSKKLHLALLVPVLIGFNLLPKMYQKITYTKFPGSTQEIIYNMFA
jgi:hypothetical protein